MMEALLVLGGVVVTAIFGWLGTVVTAKSNREAARGPDWQGFTDKIMEAQRRQLEERDERIDTLEDRITAMQADLETLRGKYRASIRHILDWRRMFPEGGPPIPPMIEGDIT